MNKKEIRSLFNIPENKGFEIRALQEEDSGKRYLEGYAAVFGSRSKLIVEPVNGQRKVFYETIERNAFDNVLDNGEDTVALINHNRERLLGRTRSKTLQLETDETGLKFRLDLPDTNEGNDLWKMVERGDFDECSFAFLVEKDRWERGEEFPLRFIENVSRLIDISVVINGAYSETSVDVEYAERSIEELETKENEDNSYLIDNDIKRMKLELMKKS